MNETDKNHSRNAAAHFFLNEKIESQKKIFLKEMTKTFLKTLLLALLSNVENLVHTHEGSVQDLKATVDELVAIGIEDRLADLEQQIIDIIDEKLTKSVSDV